MTQSRLERYCVTVRRRRSRSRSSSRHHANSIEDECPSPRTILMSDQEALHQLYGEITTLRDGAVTHQCVQTNLADVICGVFLHENYQCVLNGQEVVEKGLDDNLS
ncbi:hypothetical protein SFRURICE_005290 [Spodoptera frugiperda]|nr:hypothetical protein SFRURICE_005290 [Spodoptera frugiperda]